MRKTGVVVLSTLLTISSLGLITPTIEAASTQRELSKPSEYRITQLSKNKVSKYIDTKSSKPIDVIVELNQHLVGSFVNHQNKLKSTQAKRYQTQIGQALNLVEKKMAKIGSKVKVKQRFDTVFSGFTVSAPANEIHKLSAMPEVKAVYPVLTYKALGAGGPTVGAPTVWKMKDQQGLPVNGKGVKVAVIDTGVDYQHPDLKANYIGGYDVADRDKEPFDEEGHGTHVAGIIAANGKVKGIAPKASILAYRVLGPHGGTTGDVLTGIEMAMKDGADVVNLSLGTSANYPDDPLVSALNHATKLGVSVAVANGNDGSSEWTVGVPATAEKVISVGASTLPREYPNFQVVGVSKIFEGAMLTTIKLPNNSQFEVVDVGFGSPLDYKGLNVKGKLVLVQQGSTDQEIYIANAQKAGAGGVLLYEKGQDDLQYVEPGVDIKIPAIQITGKDAVTLKAMLKAGNNKLSVKGYTPHEFMADFSSRGPVHETWTIKPDIVAPGVEITSTLPDKNYGDLDGTSMATPHVAGAVALLHQMHPDWTPEEVKAALSNTAKLLTDLNRNRYDVMTQGAGRIDIPKAIQATTLVTPNNFTFGLIKPNSGKVKLEKKITVKNVSNKNQTYVSRVELVNGTKGIQVRVPKQVTVNKKNKAEFTLELTVDSSLPRDVYTGYLYLKEGNNESKVPFTFSIDPQSYNRVNYLSTSDLIFSPNGDRVEESTTLSYYVPTVAKHLNIYLKDIESSKTLGIIHQEENIGSGWHGSKWKGTMLNQTAVPEGIYELQAVAADDEVESSSSTLVLIDKTAPTIKANVNQEGKKIGIEIEDYLIQFDVLFKMLGLVQDDIVKVEYQLEGTQSWVRVPLAEQMEIVPPKSWLDSGKTKVTIRATDDAGNKSNVQVGVKK